MLVVMNSTANLLTELPPRPFPNVALAALPDSIQTYITFLENTLRSALHTFRTILPQQAEQITQQAEQIKGLQAQVHDLTARLNKNSSNSSKPPSSDGLNKPKKTRSQRSPSGKQPGGQAGRAGKTLNQVEKPDNVVSHAAASCSGCGHSLEGVDGVCAEKRQVFDIPETKVQVTEHRAEAKLCPCCGSTTKGNFPANVTAPAQYGERVQGLYAYFAHQHFIPADRTCQIFEDLWGISISPGTGARIDDKLFTHLANFEEEVIANLLAAKVAHFDESGMRCEKKLRWVHSVSTMNFTFYGLHEKRGQEAIDAFNILPRFEGIAIHDHWSPYFIYQKAQHGLCNSHHLRELDFIHQEEKEGWAGEMITCLSRAKKSVEKHWPSQFIPDQERIAIEQEYDAIIQKGLAYHATLPPLPSGKRGKQKQRGGKNLLDRFFAKKDSVLLFLRNFSVPFTNNQAEQDIRMVKLKQKISGCFRTFRGGQIFCRIRSYISTARKQGWRIVEVLAEAVKGSLRHLPSPQIV